MTHEPFLDRLSDYIDQLLEPQQRRDLESHLESCSDCAACLSELRAVRREARTLGPVEPPARVWEAITSELRDNDRIVRRRTRSYMTLAVAAAVVLGVGLWIAIAARPQAPDSEAALAVTIARELEAAEQHYENAIVGLEQIIRDNDGSLPPEVRQTVSSNLALIESTIVESRQAIDSEPDSAVAQDSLLQAFRRKVDLLQNTILLMNEVRKGQSENALELIDEIRKSEDPSNPS